MDNLLHRDSFRAGGANLWSARVSITFTDTVLRFRPLMQSKVGCLEIRLRAMIASRLVRLLCGLKRRFDPDSLREERRSGQRKSPVLRHSFRPGFAVFDVIASQLGRIICLSPDQTVDAWRQEYTSLGEAYNRLCSSRASLQESLCS